MDADRPLKELFRLRPRDLLALIGDAGAALVSAQVVELPSLSRRVDTVLRLRRGRESYIRHLEFEMKYRKSLGFRCFGYAVLLAMRFRVPVLTTVILVEKSGPRQLAYREILGGRVVHERRFDMVRLWEMDPERALRLGAGAAALVGTAEKTTLPLMRRAARKIQRATEGVVQSDLLFILQALSRRRYTAKQLAGVIPKETVMASSLWAEAVREGRIEGARELCLDLVRQHHPNVSDRAARLIEACSNVKRLHQWALQAPQLSDPAFLNLLKRSGSGQRARRRVPRPSRKGKARRSA